MSDDDTSERIGAAIHSTAKRIEAPSTLHAHVSPGRRTVPARRRRGVVVIAASALATIAAFAVLGVVLITDEATEPTVADAAGLALKPATQAPPALDPADRRFVNAQVGGVRFPNYAYDTSWKTLGARTDTLSGRPTMTVLYSTGGGPVGYTIVDGQALDVPKDARTVTTAGRTLWILRHDGANVVTWRQGGRTCIVSGRAASQKQLLNFAIGR
jgi:hypothetical protein